jgi:RNA polymerase sigma-70 factor, ECF subfamily
VAEPIPVSPPAVALDPPTDPRSAARDIGVDERRLAAVYAEHHTFVWRSLLRLGVDEGRVDDAVHDTFMVVAKRLREFEGRSSMRTWLFAIVMRVAQAVRRDAARDRARRDRLLQQVDDPTAPFDGADAARTLHRLLDRLDDDKRAVFVMAELEGMTAPEIAAVIGAKLPTVYSRLRLAREELERHVARARASEERKR